MKIRIFYTVNGGVYTASINTEDWSLDDLSLMAEYGEPEISVSGTIVLFPAEDGQHTALSGSSILVDSIESWDTNGLIGRTIRNITKGQTGRVTSNTSNTLVAMIGAATMLWDNGDSYEMAAVTTTLEPEETDLFRIKSDSPIDMSFDVRDYPAVDPATGVFTTAKNMANGWASTVRQRIVDARNALIAMNDKFTREEVNEY